MDNQLTLRRVTDNGNVMEITYNAHSGAVMEFRYITDGE